MKLKNLAFYKVVGKIVLSLLITFFSYFLFIGIAENQFAQMQSQYAEFNRLTNFQVFLLPYLAKVIPEKVTPKQVESYLSDTAKQNLTTQNLATNGPLWLKKIESCIDDAQIEFAKEIETSYNVEKMIEILNRVVFLTAYSNSFPNNQYPPPNECKDIYHSYFVQNTESQPLTILANKEKFVLFRVREGIQIQWSKNQFSISSRLYPKREQSVIFQLSEEDESHNLVQAKESVFQTFETILPWLNSCEQPDFCDRAIRGLQLRPDDSALEIIISFYKKNPISEGWKYVFSIIHKTESWVSYLSRHEPFRQELATNENIRNSLISASPAFDYDPKPSTSDEPDSCCDACVEMPPGLVEKYQAKPFILDCDKEALWVLDENDLKYATKDTEKSIYQLDARFDYSFIDRNLSMGTSHLAERSNDDKQKICFKRLDILGLQPMGCIQLPTRDTIFDQAYRIEGSEVVDMITQKRFKLKL